MISQNARDALDTWLRARLADEKVHSEQELLEAFRQGDGRRLSEDASAELLHERLKALEIGNVIVRAPGSKDGWWRPN